MSTPARLKKQILEKKSFLCVGLDPDPNRLPSGIAGNADGVIEFLTGIIHATKEHSVAYKLNFAFFEALGAKGWEAIFKVMEAIPSTHFTIADAKRGDIGNSSVHYAKAIFGEMNFDSVTLSPYMGSDSISPFLEYENKYAILLALTSNEGSGDFQLKKLGNGRYLYEDVIKTSLEWANCDRFMFVIGATHPRVFSSIRAYAPGHFLLVPGVGAQGGMLEEVCQNGLNADVGLLVNSSRSIIYASAGTDFATAAGEQAAEMRKSMENVINEYLPAIA